MIKNILLLIILFLNLQEVASQNTCFIGSKSYPCTDSYTLGKHEILGRNPEIYFMKDGEKGIIAFVINNYTMPHSRVKNKLILYLDNGQIITRSEEHTSEL